MINYSLSDMPTPAELAITLQDSGFTQDQAETIAAEVYQPLRGLIITLDIKRHRQIKALQEKLKD